MLSLRCIVFVVVWCCCSAAILKKCCPDEEGVLRVDKTGYREYRCIEAFNNNGTASHNKTVHPLLVGAKNTFTYGFPAGCNYSVHNYVDMEYIPTKHCIDKIFAVELLNGTVVIGKGHVTVFGCDVERMKKPNMTTISKCCLDNMVFDTEHHVCVPATNISNNSIEVKFEDFLENEADLINIKYGSPYCPPPKAIYAYTNDLYDIEFKNDKMIVNHSVHDERFVLESGSFCADQNHKGKLVVRACRDYYKGTPRVFKCCAEGYAYGKENCTGKMMCVPNTELGITIDFYDLSNMKNITRAPQPDVVGITYTISCVAKFPFRKGDFKELHYLDKDSGALVTPNYKEMYPPYCIEISKRSCEAEPSMMTLTCFPDNSNNEKTRDRLGVYSVGLTISSIFLALTLIVYIALPPLRNLHGKTIMCHVTAMLVAYSCLARVQWSEVANKYCKALGYIIYISFLSAFSWLTVMCFDIWWTFANVRSVQRIRQDKETIKFLRYSLYAWGVPILLTITAFLLDEFNVTPWLDPNIGEPQCWINTSTYKTPHLIMFILPVGLQIAANMIFFVLTAVYCNKVKSEIHRMQSGSSGDERRRRFTADKAIYIMNLKLFIVMGITWIFEIISFLVSEPIELWYLSDAINLLQGILIFCILVLKKKIFYLMKRRLGSKNNKRKRPSLQDPQLLSCLDRVQLRPRSDITMTTGISSLSSDGRRSIPWSKADPGTNGLLKKVNDKPS